jgi:23S rRNA (uracil1939-C5)-methyltransferase
MGDLVRAHAIRQLGSVDGRHGWDLYSGVGETTEALVGRGATMESIELDARAVEWATSRLRGSARAYRGSVEIGLPKLAEARFAVTNPPRTGMGAQVVTEILKRPPQRMVYISCDPATLARDLKQLCESTYRLTEVQGFDLFPQTAHLETVALLELAS